MNFFQSAPLARLGDRRSGGQCEQRRGERRETFRRSKPDGGDRAKANLGVLVGILVVIGAIVALLYWQQNRRVEDRFEPRPLFPEMDIESIARVEFEIDGKEFALQQNERGGWGLEQRAGHPIDIPRVTELVLAVATTDASGRLTQNPENYARLGVESDDPAGGRVTFLDDEGEVVADLYIGDQRTAPAEQPGGFAPTIGQYVRTGDDPWVYQIEDTLTIDREPTDWLVKEIADVEPSTIRTVRVEDEGSTGSFVLTREGEAPFALATEIPEGYEVDASAVRNAATGFSNLRMEDVMPADDPRAGRIEFTRTYAATLKNGLTYVAHLGKPNAEDDAAAATDTVTTETAAAEPDEVAETTYYLRMEAKGDPAANPAAGDERTSDSVTAEALGDPVQTAADINERLGKWVYEIPEFVYERLTKDLGDLIRPVGEEDGGADADPSTAILSFDEVPDFTDAFTGGQPRALTSPEANDAVTTP